MVQQAWLYNISHLSGSEFHIPKSVALSPLATNTFSYSDQKISNWNAEFNNSDISSTGAFTTHLKSIDLVSDNVSVNTFIAYYSGAGEELISSSHRLFDVDKWAKVSSKHRFIQTESVTLTHIASARGHHRYLLHWYEINGKHFNSTRNAKLYQTYLLLLGKEASGVKIILTINSKALKEETFVSYISNNIEIIRANLYLSLKNKS